MIVRAISVSVLSKASTFHLLTSGTCMVL